MRYLLLVCVGFLLSSNATNYIMSDLIKSAATLQGREPNDLTQEITSEMTAVNKSRFQVLRFSNDGNLSPPFNNFEIAFEGQGFNVWVILKKDGEEKCRAKLADLTINPSRANSFAGSRSGSVNMADVEGLDNHLGEIRGNVDARLGAQERAQEGIQKDIRDLRVDLGVLQARFAELKPQNDLQGREIAELKQLIETISAQLKAERARTATLEDTVSKQAETIQDLQESLSEIENHQKPRISKGLVKTKGISRPLLNEGIQEAENNNWCCIIS